MERRASPRSLADAETTATTGYTRVPAKLDDISLTGCRLVTPTRLRRGERIGLEFHALDDDAGRPTAHVVWAETRRAGVAFDRPVSAATLTLLARHKGRHADTDCNVIRLNTFRR